MPVPPQMRQLEQGPAWGLRLCLLLIGRLPSDGLVGFDKFSERSNHYAGGSTPQEATTPHRQEMDKKRMPLRDFLKRSPPVLTSTALEDGGLYDLDPWAIYIDIHIYIYIYLYIPVWSQVLVCICTLRVSSRLYMHDDKYSIPVCLSLTYEDPGARRTRARRCSDSKRRSVPPTTCLRRR